VRIDVISGRFSKRTQIWIDIVGICAFLMPFVIVAIKLVWPVVVSKYQSGEVSGNAGGLVLWPAWVLLPVGLALLGLQGLSELIKRVAFLKGLVPDPTKKGSAKSAEEELAEFLRQQEVAVREKAALENTRGSTK
jgi:TRAP-type mannitol/chloroaromatic compound transport system permease small subunit